jgi:hypothetical protein
MDDRRLRGPLQEDANEATTSEIALACVVREQGHTDAGREEQ